MDGQMMMPDIGSRNKHLSRKERYRRIMDKRNELCQEAYHNPEESLAKRVDWMQHNLLFGSILQYGEDLYQKQGRRKVLGGIMSAIVLLVSAALSLFFASDNLSLLGVFSVAIAVIGLLLIFLFARSPYKTFYDTIYIPICYAVIKGRDTYSTCYKFRDDKDLVKQNNSDYKYSNVMAVDTGLMRSMVSLLRMRKKVDVVKKGEGGLKFVKERTTIFKGQYYRSLFAGKKASVPFAYIVNPQSFYKGYEIEDSELDQCELRWSGQIGEFPYEIYVKKTIIIPDAQLLDIRQILGSVLRNICVPLNVFLSPTGCEGFLSNTLATEGDAADVMKPVINTKRMSLYQSNFLAVVRDFFILHQLERLLIDTLKGASRKKGKPAVVNKKRSGLLDGSMAVSKIKNVKRGG